MAIDPVFIAIWLVIGAVAGLLASLIVKVGSFGLIGDVIVGLVGAAIAGYLLPRVGIYIGAGFVPEVINAVIGAVILLLVARLAKGMTTKSASADLYLRSLKFRAPRASALTAYCSPAVALRGRGELLAAAAHSDRRRLERRKPR
jgi:uncharacterized membrane protein YeaQ/YmgE (transglycosylase-associated protein family)